MISPLSHGPGSVGPMSLDQWREFARRDDCLDCMVPSDLRQLIGLPRHGGKIAMPSRDLIARALAFYEGSPDGQYDDDVVVPILRAALESS